MYNLPYYKEHDQGRIQDFMRQHPFAFLSGSDLEYKPVATQVPLFIEEKDGRKFLRGHIMRNTDHHKAFAQNKNVLAVFTGKNTYVSGTWYSDPYIASTWNYMSVHVKGNIRFLETPELEEIMRLTSLHFEDYDSTSTTIYDNLPIEFKTTILKAIVAFEIEIVDISTVFKLSQDKDEESYRNIIHELKARSYDAQVIASEMEKRFEELFGKSI